MTTVAHNTNRQIVSISKIGVANWTIEYPEDVFLRMKPIELVNYKNIIIVPLSETLEAINMSDGSHVWEYDYTEEIDDIKYITQSCLKNDELAILSEEDELLLLSLPDGLELVHLVELDFGEPVWVHYMDTKQIVAYNSGGYVGLYNIDGESFDRAWSKKLGRIYLTKSAKKTMYVLDENKSKIYLVPFNGDKINELPLIWQPDGIFINNKFIGCYSDRKLYLLSI